MATPASKGAVPWQPFTTVRSLASAAVASGGAAPVNLTGSVSGSTVTLTWTAAGPEAALGYVIEAGSRAGLSDLANFDTGNAAVSFTTTGVPTGTYYVRVRLRAASGISAPSNETTLTVGSLSSPTPSGFTVDLPVAAGDAATNAYGIWPFGVHGSVHSADGHPGFDVECRPGANILAAADGEVSNAVLLDDGRYSVRLYHRVGSGSYATDYTNIASLAAGIGKGTTVSRGQTLGSAGVQSQMIGTTQVTWGMTHFQVNDFSRNEGLTNPNAVSPEPYLSPSSHALFETLWQTAAYNSEWCEPFFTGSRLATFPVTRAWTLQSGSLPAIIEIQCISGTTNQMTYALQNADRSPIESGAFSIDPAKKPLSTVTLTPSSGSPRLGVWNIVSDTLQVNLGAPGAARPSSLGGAAVYATTR
jgi:murein DD-endopeptidase MepM/ murein hydrolase activator NlpD